MSDITFRRPITWDSCSATDVGCVRAVNEDSFLDNGEYQFWLVADGMGGHEIGDVASQTIVEYMQHLRPQDSLADYVDSVEDAILHVNNRLLEYAAEELGGQTMGSTVVGMFIKDQIGICFWAGDSRVYRMRQRRLLQLTRDHSQVEEMVRLGMISPEDATRHPDKNVITRAVGVEANLCVDFDVFSVQIGDTFLLCSDGLYNSVSEHSIMKNLLHKDPETCATLLLEESLDNGADDNVTLIVVKGEPGKYV